MELWGRFVLSRVKQGDSVFLPWGAMAALPAEEFSSKAAELMTRYAADQAASTIVHPRIWEELQASPPQSMVDLARLYGRVLSETDRAWKELPAATSGERPEELADPAEEQLRRVLYGPGSITDLPEHEASRIFERDQRDRIRALERRVAAWEVEAPGSPARAMVLVDREQPVEPVIFLRGDRNRHGPRVPRRPPQILADAGAQASAERSGRRELAEAIVSPENPLTARVIVNRVWMHHFGNPLVTTPSDFGTRSDPPTHPELLDWLAIELMAHDWSLKWLHRTIMTSATYQQSSYDAPANRRGDPENRLLWRMNRRRLEFEAMRDALLFVAGGLDPTLGGRPVDLEAFSPAGVARRSIYGLIDRNNFSSLLRTFDYPNPDATSAERPSTVVPQQALFGMNAPFVQEVARAVGARPEMAAAPTSAAKVQSLYRAILGREPDDAELRLAVEYLESPSVGLAHVAQALLMTNEFAFVD